MYAKMLTFALSGQLSSLRLNGAGKCDKVRWKDNLNLVVRVYMDDTRKKRSKGMGLVSTLVTLFIILKLTKVISWSWLWVFSPIWITAIIAVMSFSLILVAGRINKGTW